MQICTEELSDKVDIFQRGNEDIREGDDILVANMLEELELSISSLCQDRSGEWLHDLLDGDALTSQLVLCRTYEAECAHSDGLEVDIARCDLEDAGCGE